MKKEYKSELVDIFMRASKNRGLLEAFLSDLLTPTEYREMAVRWQIVKRLKDKEPHRNISRDLKIGIATVSRGSRALADNKGGFATLIKLSKPKK